ncbi:Protein tex, partial [human gut metagenome]
KLSERLTYLRNLQERKADVRRLIEEQEKFTEEIGKALEKAQTLNTRFLMCFLYFASSEIFSAIISKAPDIASSADFTPFSSLIYFDASSSILPVNFPSLI